MSQNVKRPPLERGEPTVIAQEIANMTKGEKAVTAQRVRDVWNGLQQSAPVLELVEKARARIARRAVKQVVPA